MSQMGNPLVEAANELKDAVERLRPITDNAGKGTMALEDLNLPTLPNGWHYETSHGSTEIVHVVWTDHGAVSIHLHHRTIGSGWCTPRSADHGVELPKGRNWKAKLVETAVAHLQAVWA